MRGRGGRVSGSDPIVLIRKGLDDEYRLAEMTGILGWGRRGN
jgi:hypothetical protein